MAIKTKKNSASNQNEWKSLFQGFIENIFEKLSDNISQKVHNWIKMLKRKTIGFLLVVFGFLYLLIGFSVFLNSLLGQIIPGLGYVTAGVLAMLVGYLVGKSEA